jgi:putative tryptophan/tyrosine transport system substrate-binding protein
LTSPLPLLSRLTALIVGNNKEAAIEHNAIKTDFTKKDLREEDNERTSLDRISVRRRSKIQNLNWLALGAMLLALSVPAEAQQPTKVPRIGFLAAASPAAISASTEAFRQGLRERGYMEGQNIAIEYRFAEGREDRLPDLAAELVGLKIAVIVTSGTPATQAAKQATGTIPIVMAAVGDPVGVGFVTSLARPGGNITGLSLLDAELDAKRLELLKEAVPGLSRVGALWSATDAGMALAFSRVQSAAHTLGLQLRNMGVRHPDDFQSTFQAAKRGRAEALIVLAQPFTLRYRTQIVNLAINSQLPTMYTTSGFVNAGGLMSYAPSLNDMWRRAAYYVDRILKGAKPANLPVEQPTKVELVINLKTAKALGLTIPQSILIRADEVIE